ncbi:Xaa-Pro aminopeptidase [Candidatus Endobugula sertula]|uniref:Xaa-Pro aminopeptidase n=1 Tax=Candidatus Endobugula sertula TaxID=62101 RepID=A0A1D2QT09_9GAMM|nr:Xaa-Pro aminopeptidase [Candidatus Endobugula sertula]
MPQMTKQEFSRRRKALIDHMEPNSIAILPAATEKVRNRDVHYAYRQDSDFFYLSGFPEPDAVLAIVPGRDHGETILFCREKNREREIWDGYRVGPEGACEEYGADDAFPIGDLNDILPGLLEGRERVYYSMGRDQGFDLQVMGWVNHLREQARSGAIPPGEFLNLDYILHDLRLFKSAAEVRVMRQAAEISAEAHCAAMRLSKPGLYEYQLEAEIMHRFMQAGSRTPAYSSIVGSGANACILHYTENTRQMKDGELVLIDAGCELEHYASDVTRTFPVNGKFSQEQKAVYQLVLDAQTAALDVSRPGNHWDAPHEASIKVITQGLVDLGLLNGEVDALIANGAYKQFYMHRIGHWLGMDVHDVGDYKIDGEWRLLEPGIIMTVEPGIYIAPDDKTVAKKWRGIGVRIEDDVLITKEGNDVLSKDVPKAIVDIEQLMRTA